MAKRSKQRVTDKSSSRPRTRKTRTDVPGGDAPVPGKGHNAGPGLTAAERKALFLSHRSTWIAYQAKQKALDEQRTEIVAALKADGFLLEHMKVADDFASGAKGEARQVDNVKRRLEVAYWIGHPMGNQLDLFQQPDRTPLADRAYEEGQRASMQNEPRKPPASYAPGSEPYERWMAGYADDQERIAAGFKKPADDEAAKTQAAVEDDEGGNQTAAVTSGTMVSRAEFKRRLAENAEVVKGGAS